MVTSLQSVYIQAPSYLNPLTLSPQVSDMDFSISEFGHIHFRQIVVQSKINNRMQTV